MNGLNALYPNALTFVFMNQYINIIDLETMQMVGMAIYSFLVVFFYTFLGLFLGNRIAEITITTLFSFVVMYQIRL